MRKLLFVALCLTVLVQPVLAIADYYAGALGWLQLSGPNTDGSTDYFGGTKWQETFAQSSPYGLAEKKAMDHPPDIIPGCAAGDIDCYNRYAAGYSEADLSKGILKSSAISEVAYTYDGGVAKSWPNQSVAIARLMDTLTVTVPAGNQNYYIGVKYDISGTMSGFFEDASNRGLASVGYMGSIQVLGYDEGDGMSASFNWLQETMTSGIHPYTTDGEFGINLLGQAEATAFTILLKLDLYSEAYVWGLGPDQQAASDFGSTAHAALRYDPGLIVSAEGGFPGAPSVPVDASVPEPSTMILLGMGMLGLVGMGRRK